MQRLYGLSNESSQDSSSVAQAQICGGDSSCSARSPASSGLILESLSADTITIDFGRALDRPVCIRLPGTGSDGRNQCFVHQGESEQLPDAVSPSLSDSSGLVAWSKHLALDTMPAEVSLANLI